MSRESLARREFGRRLAAGTMAVAVGRAAVADDPAPPKPPAPPAPGNAPDPDDAPGDGPPFGPPPPAVLLVEFIHQKYPHEKLTVDELEKIEKDVQAQLFRGNALAKYPFRNSDEPATVFSAYRAE